MLPSVGILAIVFCCQTKCAVETKKHSRTSPEIQFNELNEKLKSTLPDQQIN